MVLRWDATSFLVFRMASEVTNNSTFVLQNWCRINSKGGVIFFLYFLRLKKIM